MILNKGSLKEYAQSFWESFASAITFKESLTNFAQYFARINCFH